MCDAGLGFRFRVYSNAMSSGGKSPHAVIMMFEGYNASIVKHRRGASNQTVCLTSYTLLLDTYVLIVYILCHTMWTQYVSPSLLVESQRLQTTC